MPFREDQTMPLAALNRRSLRQMQIQRVPGMGSATARRPCSDDSRRALRGSHMVGHPYGQKTTLEHRGGLADSAIGRGPRAFPGTLAPTWPSSGDTPARHAIRTGDDRR